MMVVFRLLSVAQPADSFNHVVLGISLARINYVIDRIHAAEMWMVGLACFSRDPHLAPIRITIEALVAKVAPQQTKLPQMVSYVLSDIGHRVIRADNYLGIF